MVVFGEDTFVQRFVAAGLPTKSLFKAVINTSTMVAPVLDNIISVHTSASVDEITNAVTKCIAEQLCVQPQDVTLEKRLVTHLGADSLDLVELTMFLEDVLMIEITNEQTEQVSTVKDVVDLTVRLRQEQVNKL